jgi:hypothetical protein
LKKDRNTNKKINNLRGSIINNKEGKEIAMNQERENVKKVF